MESIEDSQVTTLLTSLVISLLHSLNECMPDHSRKARAIRKVEEAIRDLAKLNASHLDKDLCDIGARIWNNCLEQLQDALEAAEPCNQYSLFYLIEDEYIYTTEVDVCSAQSVVTAL